MHACKHVSKCLRTHTHTHTYTHAHAQTQAQTHVRTRNTHTHTHRRNRCAPATHMHAAHKLSNHAGGTKTCWPLARTRRTSSRPPPASSSSSRQQLTGMVRTAGRRCRWMLSLARASQGRCKALAWPSRKPRCVAGGRQMGGQEVGARARLERMKCA